jgi:dTDP-4-amino-4,6-dideoxygalactose transaminase
MPTTSKTKRDIEFFRPSINSQELNEMQKLFNAPSISKVEELEDMIADDFETSEIITTSSGTSALHLALSAMDFKRGDKVIMSVNSPIFLPETVRHFDAQPIFVDIEKDSMSIDLEKLEDSLKQNASRKLKAVIVSHIAGNIIDIKKVIEIAKKYKVRVIEDCTSALGAVVGDTFVGSSKETISIFSFERDQENSIVNAGFIVTDDEQVIENAKLLRFHAKKNLNEGDDDYDNPQPNYFYDVVKIGYKYDLSELDATYALVQYAKNRKFIDRRVTIAKKYISLLSDLKHIELPKYDENSIFTHFIVQISKNRDSFAKELKIKGIDTSLHYTPVHLLSYYKNKYELKVNSFPNALNNYQRILSIPIYADLSDEEVEYICKSIKEVASSWV